MEEVDVARDTPPSSKISADSEIRTASMDALLGSRLSTHATKKSSPSKLTVGCVWSQLPGHTAKPASSRKLPLASIRVAKMFQGPPSAHCDQTAKESPIVDATADPL